MKISRSDNKLLSLIIIVVFLLNVAVSSAYAFKNSPNGDIFICTSYGYKIISQAEGETSPNASVKHCPLCYLDFTGVDKIVELEENDIVYPKIVDKYYIDDFVAEKKYLPRFNYLSRSPPILLV